MLTANSYDMGSNDDEPPFAVAVTAFPVLTTRLAFFVQQVPMIFVQNFLVSTLGLSNNKSGFRFHD